MPVIHRIDQAAQGAHDDRLEVEARLNSRLDALAVSLPQALLAAMTMRDDTHEIEMQELRDRIVELETALSSIHTLSG